MAASVDADLPVFRSLDDAILFVAERGGGVVRTPDYDDVMADTSYGRGMRAAADRLGVRLEPMPQEALQCP
jgi:hypothetical protein